MINDGRIKFIELMNEDWLGIGQSKVKPVIKELLAERKQLVAIAEACWDEEKYKLVDDPRHWESREKKYEVLKDWREK